MPSFFDCFRVVLANRRVLPGRSYYGLLADSLTAYRAIADR